MFLESKDNDVVNDVDFEDSTGNKADGIYSEVIGGIGEDASADEDDFEGDDVVRRSAPAHLQLSLTSLNDF